MELLIKETLEKLLEVLGVNFTGVTIKKSDYDVFYAQIETNNSSLLIGWHGETISAIQHILKCLLWKQGATGVAQVVVDVDGYKKRQEDSVIKLAERKAEYAIESQKEVRLPPMNPYFRRKVHMHLANSDKYKDYVLTESIGSDPDRSIKIIPK